MLAAACVVTVVRISGPVSVRRIATGPVAGCLAIGAVALVAGTGLAALVLAGVAYPLVLVAVEQRLFPSDVRGLRNSLRLASPTE